MFRFVDNATVLISVFKLDLPVFIEVPTFLVWPVFVLWFQLSLSEILAASSKLSICY